MMDAYHAVLEVRYRPTPRYLDTRGAILDEFKEKYSELQIEDLPVGPPLGDLAKHVRLANSRRGVRAFVNGQHCGFEVEFEPFDLEGFASEAERFCRTVVRDILRIESIARIGMRFWYRWSVPGDDLLGFVLQNMLHCHDDLSGMDLKVNGYQLRFAATDDDYQYTFQYYPEPGTEEETLTGFLVADFDVYQQNQPITALTAARNLIQDAQQRSLDLGTQIQRGIFGNG